MSDCACFQFTEFMKRRVSAMVEGMLASVEKRKSLRA